MTSDTNNIRSVCMVYILVLYMCCTRTDAANNTEQALQKILFSDYNCNVMPNKNKSTPLEATISLHLTSIDDVDEKKQSMTIRATLGISWKDEYLMWDPDQYVGVNKINVRYEDVWSPDIALKHTFHRNTDLGQAGGRASITYEGMVTIWPYKLYTVACKIYIAKFPFDRQRCVFIFVPWTNPSESIKLKSSQKVPDLSQMSESGEWHVLGAYVEEETLPFENDTYDYVYFTIDLQRKSLYHVINMIVPVMCISLLNVAGFLLPSHGGERVTLSISIFLTLAVFLTVVNSSMPESSDEVSALSVYVGLQLFGSAIAVLMTVVSLTLFHHDDRNPVPKPIKLLVRMCCAKKRQWYEASEDNHTPACNGTDKHTLHDCNGAENRVSNGCNGAEKHALGPRNGAVANDNHVKVTWRMVSEALDRFCLFTSLIWHILLTASLMLSLTL